MKKIIIIIFCIIFCLPIYAKDYIYSNNHHIYKESIYQHAWCSANNGIEEYQNKDFTRVDCLTKTNAVEFDFASKWAESIGQALHYGLMTGEKAKVVLILEYPKKQMYYFNKVKTLSKIYNFDAEYITPDILK